MINNIDYNKAYQKGNIPPKLLKVSSDISATVLSSEILRFMKKSDICKYEYFNTMFWLFANALLCLLLC